MGRRMPAHSRNHFRLWRFALRRLRYLCFDIFLRRFLTNEPMKKPRFRKGETTHGRTDPPLIQTGLARIRLRHPTGVSDSARRWASPSDTVVSIRWVTPARSHIKTLPASLVSSSKTFPAASS